MLLVDCWKQHAISIYLYTGATGTRIYENYIAEKQSYKFKNGWNPDFLKPNTQTLKHKVSALTLFRMGFFGAAHECHTYPTMIKLLAVIPHLKKIQNTYESYDTPLVFCWHQYF